MSDHFSGYNVDWTHGSEEPWEKRIASLLGSLPPVEPPPGFLEALTANGPTLARPFTLDAETPFAFPVADVDDER